MDDKDQAFESLKSKLRKLQALVEQGYKGEAETAKRLLDKLCEQYGVSLDEVINQEQTNRYRFEVGKGKIWLDLFMQCYANVTGQKELRYFKNSNSSILVWLTAYQFAELCNLFFWHKTNLKKDIEQTRQLVFEAYIQKHRIFRDRSKDPEGETAERPDKPIDFDRLGAVVAMMNNLNDNRYYKMIERK